MKLDIGLKTFFIYIIIPFILFSFRITVNSKIFNPIFKFKFKLDLQILMSFFLQVPIR